MRYLNYFDQILLKGFIPMTRQLNLDKIVIVFDAKPGKKKTTAQSGVNELELEEEFIKNVFFRVYVGSEEKIVYDQLIE